MLVATIAVCLLLGASPIDDEIAKLKVDQVNVALRNWGYAHASASSIYGAGYEADNAIDGRWAVRERDKWNSAQGPGAHWLMVDLGHAFLIDAVVLRHEGVYSDGGIFNTSDFEIQSGASAKGPWRDLAAPVHGNHDDISLIRFAPTKARYVRFVTTKGEQGSNGFARLFEMEVYAPKNSADIPLTQVVWPDIPTYRHVGKKLEAAAFIDAVKPIGTRTYRVDGRTAQTVGGGIWLPAQGRAVTVTAEEAGMPTARWTMQDDRSWMATSRGGAIHLLSSSHQDVAWIDTPDVCRVNRVNQILEPAIDLMARDPRYHFTMENMLNLQELLQLRPGKRSVIERLLRNGQLEFGGTYNQPYEALLGGEQLIRQTYFGRRWLRKQFPGVDTHFAFSVDVPGRSIQMQQILAKAGIRYFVTSRFHEGLFRWSSPDGSSLLVYALPHYGNHSGTLKEEPEQAVRDIPNAIRKVAQDFAKENVPPHYMVLNSQDFEPPHDFSPLIERWSKLPALAIVDGQPVPPPTFDYSSTSALFKALDVPSARPPEMHGERPNMWLYIHGPTHYEAIAEQRRAARVLPAAEVFATMQTLLEGNAKSYPGETLSAAWKSSLYPDHGFGGKNGHITDAIYRDKFGFAAQGGLACLGFAELKLAEHVRVDRKKGIPVVVFNPHSWNRTDVVKMAAPDKNASWRLVDSVGHEVPCQIDERPFQVDEGTIRAEPVVSWTGKFPNAIAHADWWNPIGKVWQSPASAAHPAHVTIDMRAPHRVNRIVLYHYGAWGEFEKETVLNTRGFSVLGSLDQVKWRVLGSAKGNQLPITDLRIAPARVRFVKLKIDDPNAAGDGIARVLSMKVFASESPLHAQITFQAENVPSLGYKTFYLQKRVPVRPQAISHGRVVENNFYRIKLVPGGVSSIYDKQAHSELLRPSKLAAGEVFTMKSEGNGAGEFGAVQQPTMDGFDHVGAHKPEWRRVDGLSGTVSETYELVQPMGGAFVRQRLVAYRCLKRIDFDVELEGWNGTKYREFRLALPIGGPKSKVDYEAPMGTVHVGEDEIKSTGGKAYGSLDYWQQCADIHPREVQDFIRVRDGKVITTVSSCVSVFDYIDPTGMAGHGPLIQPILLASRKSCHGEGNWYTQPGDHSYHFSLTSGADADLGWRDAAAAQLPMEAVNLAHDAHARHDLPELMSFASVDKPNVRISTIKRAEDDNSVIVRSYDMDGKPCDATISLFLPVRSAKICNIIEDPIKNLPVRHGKVIVHVGKYSVETIKVDALSQKR